MKSVQDGKERMVFVDTNKFLHTSMDYEFIGDIRSGDKLTSSTRVGRVWEKDLRLFIEFLVETTNQNGEVMLKTKNLSTVAPGGY